MNCIDPPALTDLDLAMYLDGEAASTVAHHVATCSACRANAAELAQQETMLRALLYRSNCPTPEELRDYQLGLLSRADGSNITLHLAHCPHCARELFVLREFITETPPLPEHLAAQLALLVARLVNQTTGKLALAGQRGAPTVLLYEAGELQIGLEIVDDPVSGHKAIHGILTGGDLTDLLVHLWVDGALLASAPVDPLLGDFHLTDLAIPDALAAQTELLISAQQVKVRVPALPLNP